MSQQRDVELKLPDMTRSTSTHSFARRFMPRLDMHVKLFGMMTCLTMAVVVGMSVYVVYSNEVRFDVSADRLTNKDGVTLITAKQESTRDTLFETLQLETSQLRHLETLAFFVRLTDGEIAQILLKIDRIMRFTNSGRTEICSSSGACLIAADDDDAVRLNANYTEGFGARHCPTTSSCAVLLDGPQGELARRQLAAVRRQLQWWNPFSWFSSPPPSPPPPVWQATDSCPWICKQGWFWEDTAYGKPACCGETRDSGSPYDTCQFDSCSCDVQCRSCCD